MKAKYNINYFEDSSEDLEIAKKYIPSLLYKFRDWQFDTHKSSLKDTSIWFTNPKDLNDKFDIRVPYTFDYNEINNPKFYEIVQEIMKVKHPEFIRNKEHLDNACDNLMDIIKSNPKKWFENNYKDVREGNSYNIVGVFSLTKTALEILMWAHYGNSNKGFCIGYDGLEIWLKTKASGGSVKYSNIPTKHSFLNQSNEESLMELFFKSKQWEYEKEYRFVTTLIHDEKDRLFNLNPSAIKEVILGKDISYQHESEIKLCLKDKYKSKVQLFKIEENLSTFGYDKMPVLY